MSDYKNRDDVITEIKRFKGYLDDDMITRLTIAIDRVPSADVVQVVRCKDCKHLYKDGECPLRTWFTHDEDDYCSYGERKEHNNEQVYR